MKSLNSYLHDFVSLNVASTKGQKAPHKAVLLVAIMRMISEGKFPDNKIVLTEELVEQFNAVWKSFIGESSVFSPKVATPFWHLQNEPFYHLFFNDGTPASNIANPYSVTKLRNIVYASLDEDLFNLILAEDSRDELQSVLIINYLTESKQ